ncbi:glycosyltransferase family 4 protein [Pseudomonas putida]|uniref:glycosyltransferase family 4 protein n=1 Tax=Pseudomonas putida TaxID=303 RepID=UPI001F5C727D|nr:glycosyltransferase family 4 protein [Pseudomonas putida]MBO0368802.1 glycosyltransferase family 4 protein [Pseudomonas putida]
MLVWNEFRNDARVLKEAQTLQAAGHEVTVFALHTPGVTQSREVLPGNIRVVRVGRTPLWKLRKRTKVQTRTNAATAAGPVPHLSSFKRVLRIAARLWTHAGLLWSIIRHRPDVVHSHDVNTLPTSWLAARLSRARLIYDAHEISTSREGYSSFRKLVAVVERQLMPRADGTITTTVARAKFFARAYAISRPLVLQNRPRQQEQLRTSRIRDELGLANPWPIVVYQGGIQQGRGLERLARVAADVPETYFVFIGGGRLEHNLRTIVAELELQDRVRFIPTVSLADLPSYTASADIGVQPIENTCLNHYTTDSNKLFEYIQAGLPVVASDLPEIRSVVRQHDAGILVEPGNTESLAHALRQLVSSSATRQHHAARAQSAALILNWEAQEQELVELYRQVLQVTSSNAVEGVR